MNPSFQRDVVYNNNFRILGGEKVVIIFLSSRQRESLN